MRIVGGFIALAVVAIVALLLWPAPDGARKSNASQSPAAASGHGPLAPDAVLAIVPRSEFRNPAGPARFVLSASGREFYEKKYGALYARLAKGPRTPEENFMLARILESCALVPGEAPRGAAHPIKEVIEGRRAKLAAALSPSDPDRERRLAAFDAIMRNPCEGLEQLKSTRAEIDQLYRDGAAAGDPKARLALARQELREAMKEKGRNSPMPKLGDDQMALIRLSLSSNDPTTALEAVDALMFPFGNASLRDSDGKPVEYGPLRNAATLVACDAGYPCGADSPQVAGACAYSGHCDAASLRDYLFYYAGSPHDSQMVARYENALRVAGETGQLSFEFFPAPSPMVAIFQ